MNFSELVLHYGYNIKAFNDLFRKGHHQKPFKNFSFQTSNFVSPIKDPNAHGRQRIKDEIKHHIKPNNNPRLSLIQKTKELIHIKKDRKPVE